MLGHGPEKFDFQRYSRQCLVDNIALLSPELLATVNDLIVQAGHQCMGVKTDSALQARCDSFVVETEQARLLLLSKDAAGSGKGLRLIAKWKWIQHRMEWTQHLMDQIRRRILEGKKIAHGEKIFSIFEEHIRWCVKGKAGWRVELGVLVAIIQDQHQFALGHDILWTESDVDMALPLLVACRHEYPKLSSCSFDRGLNRVRTHGKEGFARTVALSVVAANCSRLGDLLLEREKRKRLRRAASAQLQPPLGCAESTAVGRTVPDFGGSVRLQAHIPKLRRKWTKMTMFVQEESQFF